jgi:NitT/TauT family transport system substrate-binding protein
MRYPEFGSSLYGSALVAKRSFAEQNSAALTALVECVAEGFATSVRQPEVAIAALHARDGLVNRQVEQERMQLSLDWSVVTPWVRKNGMGQVDPVRLKKSMQEVSSALSIPAPDVAEVYTTKYLPPAAKLVIAR